MGNGGDVYHIRSSEVFWRISLFIAQFTSSWHFTGQTPCHIVKEPPSNVRPITSKTPAIPANSEQVHLLTQKNRAFRSQSQLAWKGLQAEERERRRAAS